MVYRPNVVNDLDHRHHVHFHYNLAVVLGNTSLAVVSQALVNTVYRHQIHCHNPYKMMVDTHSDRAHNNHSQDDIVNFHLFDLGSNKCPFQQVEHQLIRKYLGLGRLDQADN